MSPGSGHGCRFECRRIQSIADESRGTYTGPSLIERGQADSKHHSITDGRGTPLAVLLIGGNRKDVALLLPLLAYHACVMTEIYACRMLHWALDQSRGDTSKALSVEQWMKSENAPVEFAQPAVSHLAANGWIDPLFQQANGYSPFFTLSHAGLLEAQHEDKARRDRRERILFAENALLHWVFNLESPESPNELVNFFIADDSFFFGDQLSVDEVESSKNYLVQRELCGGTLVGIYLRPDGRDCVLSGRTVREYVERRIGNGDWTVTVNNSPGSVIGQQERVEQTNTFNGADLSQVAVLVQQLRAIAPSLGLSAEDAKEYDEDVEALETATDNPGLWRRAWRGVRPMLVRQGVGIANTGIVELGDQIRDALH